MKSQTSSNVEASHRDSAHQRLVILPRGRLASVDLKQLWTYRDLLRTFASRDITLRYRQTALGVIWVVLQPLLTALIFTFVFGRVARLSSEGVPYIVFSYSGLLAWNVFSGLLTRASGSLTAAGPMVSKVFFPRLLLPLSVLGSVLLDFSVALVLQAILLISYGVNPRWHIILLPLWLLLLLGISSGVSMIAAALAVRYRDVQYVIPLLIQLLLFASPVGYDVASVPRDARWAVTINPLTGLLQAFRWSILGRGSLSLSLVYSSIAAVSIAVLGGILFSSFERDFADVI